MKKMRPNKPFRVIDVLLITTLALTLLAMTTISGCGVIRPMGRISVSADEFHGQLERTGPDYVSPNTNLNHTYVIVQPKPGSGVIYE